MVWAGPREYDVCVNLIGSDTACEARGMDDGKNRGGWVNWSRCLFILLSFFVWIA